LRSKKSQGAEKEQLEIEKCFDIYKVLCVFAAPVAASIRSSVSFESFLQEYKNDEETRHTQDQKMRKVTHSFDHNCVNPGYQEI